jgi:hypothetical protein
VSSFEVSTGSLLQGAGLMEPSSRRVELNVGAAQDTPAASAWGEVAAATNRLVQESDEAIEGLVKALQSAADAYSIADESAAASLGR